MGYKLGEQCKHGSLKRKCDICWLEDENEKLRARLAEAREAIKRALDWYDEAKKLDGNIDRGVFVSLRYALAKLEEE
jgi:hypothetical protein